MKKEFIVCFIVVLMNVLSLNAQYDFSLYPDNIWEAQLRSILKRKSPGAELVLNGYKEVGIIKTKEDFQEVLDSILSDNAYTCTFGKGESPRIMTFKELESLDTTDSISRREIIRQVLSQIPDSIMNGMRCIRMDWCLDDKEYQTIALALDDKGFILDAIGSYYITSSDDEAGNIYSFWKRLFFVVLVFSVGLVLVLFFIQRRQILSLRKDVVRLEEDVPVVDVGTFCSLIRSRDYFVKIKRIIEYYKNYSDYEEHFTKIDQLQLVQDVDIQLGNFTVRLKRKYPELTAEDIDFCCLYLLELSGTEIAIILERDRSTIFRREKKILKDKMGSSANSMMEVFSNL